MVVVEYLSLKKTRPSALGMYVRPNGGLFNSEFLSEKKHREIIVYWV